MKALTSLIFLILSINVSADRMSFEIGASNDKINFKNFDTVTKKEASGSTKESSADLGVSILKELSGRAGIEQSLSINFTKFSEIPKSHGLRYDATVAINLGEDFKLKVGPSLAYRYDSLAEQSSIVGLGYKLAAEYSVYQNIFVELGYYRSNLNRKAGSSDIDLKIESYKLKLGFGF